MRNYYLGVLILVIIGIGYGVYGIFQLMKMRRIKHIFIYFLFVFGFPLVCLVIYDISKNLNENMRFWIFVPFGVFIPFWLLFGFVINKKVENIKKGIDYKDSKSFRRRLFGSFLLLISLITWLLGAFGLVMSKVLEAVLLIICLYCLVLGMMYLLTGKPFEKIDE